MRLYVFVLALCVVRMNNNALFCVCVSLECFIMRKMVFADDV